MRSVEQVPFEGSGSGYLIVTLTRDERVVRTQGFCTGKSAHLGSYSVVAQESIDLETFTLTEGSFTLTAANGDTISGTYSGQGAPDGEPGVISFSASGFVTEGTGRWAGARGELSLTGLADLPAGELSQSLSGTLSTSGPHPRPKK